MYNTVSTKTSVFAKFLTVAAILYAGSAVAATNSITIYTGRSKTLVEPIVQQFQKETGIKVEVRYATDSALLATLEEEGKRSPADLFWANSSGTLGLASERGLLRALPASLVKKTADYYSPSNNAWLPLSVRFRVLAYNNKVVDANTLPKSVWDLPKLSQFKNKLGLTPSYASFQDFIGAMIAIKGEAATREWLLGIKALNPKLYGSSNMTMMEALRSGEIDIALSNHYYIQRLAKGGAPLGTHYFAAGDAGNLALVTGVGLLKTSKNLAANKLINYLVSNKAQQFFTGELFEYPTISSTITPSSLLPYKEATNISPKIDQEKMGARLEGAQKLLRDVGLL